MQVLSDAQFAALGLILLATTAQIKALALSLRIMIVNVEIFDTLAQPMAHLGRNSEDVGEHIPRPRQPHTGSVPDNATDQTEQGQLACNLQPFPAILRDPLVSASTFLEDELDRIATIKPLSAKRRRQRKKSTIDDIFNTV